MKDAREKSGIEVEVMDLKPSLDNATVQLAEGLKGTPYDKVTTCGTIGFVRTKKGVFILEAEGVIQAKPLKETNKWALDLYPCTQNAKGQTEKMQLMPIAVMHIGPSDIDNPDIPIKEKVPLEQFINSFGRRLEVNYGICLSLLRKAMK